MVRETPVVCDHLLEPYLTWVATERGRSDFTKVLEAALAALSITGGFGDSRDTLLWLDSLWTTAAQHRIDPRPFFKEFAELSDTEETRHPILGGSTKGFILLLLKYSPRTGKPRSGDEIERNATMIGAIAGDIIGSVHEGLGTKNKRFPHRGKIPLGLCSEERIMAKNMDFRHFLRPTG